MSVCLQLYSVYLDGFLFCRVRYSQLHHWNEQVRPGGGKHQPVHLRQVGESAPKDLWLCGFRKTSDSGGLRPLTCETGLWEGLIMNCLTYRQMNYMLPVLIQV